jgi:GNAT superfamily N-acetyltransferase
MDPKTDIRYDWYVVDLEHDGEKFAIFFAFDRSTGVVVATAKVNPWIEGARPVVSGVHVVPGQRGRGIGTGLMKYILQIASNYQCPAISLWVHRENAPARSLYHSIGFRAFYEDGDQIFYATELGSENGH